jgi:hypothetical protein
MSSGGKKLLGVTWEGCFLLVTDVEVVVSVVTIFNYYVLSKTCVRFWCNVQLLRTLVGVVPIDSALIAGNVVLATINYFPDCRVVP